jgi:hypothetical protein
MRWFSQEVQNQAWDVCAADWWAGPEVSHES